MNVPQFPHQKAVYWSIGIILILLIIPKSFRIGGWQFPIWGYWAIYGVLALPIAYMVYWGFRQNCKVFAWSRIAIYAVVGVLIWGLTSLTDQFNTTYGETPPAPTGSAPTNYVWYKDPVSWISIFLIGSFVALIGVMLYYSFNRTKYPAQYRFVTRYGLLIGVAIVLIVLLLLYLI